jgi:hypothetical protein
MTYSRILGPRQLAMLTQTLERYCEATGIKRGSPEHDDASRRVMALFENGISTAEELDRVLRSGANQLDGL